MAHTLTNKNLSRGISNPLMVQSPDEKCGTSNGPGGYNWRVTEMMLQRYGSLEMSNSSIKHCSRPWPSRLFISTLALFKMSGWLSTLNIAHSSVIDDVSVLPISKI